MNMKRDNLYTGSEVKKRLISGINKCVYAVGSTMGTGGANGLIEAIESPGHLTTNDGATILNSIKLGDPIEEMGRKILVEAVTKANGQSGDGSSTTTVLTGAIIEEGAKKLKKISPIELKKSLEECIPFIEKSLNEQTTEILVEDVKYVASISAEDEQIGNLIAEIYSKLGKDGIIYWDISKTNEDSYKIGTGITIDDAGFVSPYMADIDEKSGQFLNQAKWKNPKILLLKQKISSAADFNNLFQDLFNKDIREVVVFCDEYEAPIVADLVKTRAVRGFKTLLIKMPILWKDEWYEDISKATGAKIIDPIMGKSLKDATIDDLGTVENIIVTKDTTYLDGIKDLTNYLETIEDTNRKARLNTKTARLYLGALSESALSYKRLKVEDAISAAYQALHGGIVPGGGTALRNAARSLPKTVGGEILKKALLRPILQIANNAGASIYKQALILSEEDGYGLNTQTGEIEDLFDSGVVDPKNVVLNAAKNAISVAASILATNTAITLPIDNERV